MDQDINCVSAAVEQEPCFSICVPAMHDVAMLAYNVRTNGKSMDFPKSDHTSALNPR
jgi:hypothetical protein